MLSQFTRQQQTYTSLDLARGDGGTLVVVSQLGGLGGNTLKDVVHKGVHDGHGFGGDTSVRMDLLQNLVDIDGEGFTTLLLLLLLVGSTDGFLGLAGLLNGLS